MYGWPQQPYMHQELSTYDAYGHQHHQHPHQQPQYYYNHYQQLQHHQQQYHRPLVQHVSRPNNIQPLCGPAPTYDARDDDLGSLSSGSGCNRSSREIRNLAEKKRRDTLNSHINELSTLVPMVASSSKKMDKTSVLRLAATYLRMNKTLTPDRNWPHFSKLLDTVNLSQYLMEDLEGFLVIVTAGARIIFISHTVEKYLGHSQNDLMGQDLYGIVHEDDREELKKHLTPDGGFPCCPGSDGHVADDSSSSESVSSCSSGQSSPGPPAADVTSSTTERLRDPPVERQRRSFVIRMSQKSCSRGDQREYEFVHIVGDLRVPTRIEVNLPPTRSRRPKDCRYNENDIVLVGVGRVYREKSVSTLSLLEATKEEYITRHEPTGKMTYIDHRIAIVAGYMSEEVLGKSAFNFMHKEDVTWTMIALKRMYDKGDGFGCSTYRLRAKNGDYVYLRTCGYLEFDQNTQRIDSFICVNTLISDEEGEKGIEEMRKTYSPHFLAVGQKFAVTNVDEGLIEKMCQTLLSNVKSGDRVSSSTEIATRPSVVRELSSVQRVSSSTTERSLLKRSIEDSPRMRKIRKMSPLDEDVEFGTTTDLLDLDLSLQPLPHPNPPQIAPYRSNWKEELSGEGEHLQLDTQLLTRQDTPNNKTGKAPKKGAKPLMKSTTQVQQEMEHMLCKTKRGISNVSV